MTHVLEVAYRNGVPPRFLRTRADIDGFVAELLEAGWEHTSASVYAMAGDSAERPDHEMIVGADKTTGLGAVRYTGGDELPGDDAAEWFSVGDRVNPDGVEFAYFGTGHDFPADSEVSLDVVRQAMWELMESGGKRPVSVVWRGRV